jgi:atypical dual specificity phosphatase
MTSSYGRCEVFVDGVWFPCYASTDIRICLLQQQMGLFHLKIRIPGRAIPLDSHYERFRNEVDKFLADPAARGKFIGVHCTHGVNRTGWFVCRYLMERMGMSAREAIVVFNEARGHEMHRPYLTDDLINRCRARAAR